MFRWMIALILTVLPVLPAQTTDGADEGFLARPSDYIDEKGDTGDDEPPAPLRDDRSW